MQNALQGVWYAGKYFHKLIKFNFILSLQNYSTQVKNTYSMFHSGKWKSYRCLCLWNTTRNVFIGGYKFLQCYLLLSFWFRPSLCSHIHGGLVCPHGRLFRTRVLANWFIFSLSLPGKVFKQASCVAGSNSGFRVLFSCSPRAFVSHQPCPPMRLLFIWLSSFHYHRRRTKSPSDIYVKVPTQLSFHSCSGWLGY